MTEQPREEPREQGRRLAPEDTLVRRVARLRSRLIVLALIALAGLTGLALVLAWHQYQDGKQQAVRNLRSRAVVTAALIDTYVAGQLSTLRSIGASPSLTNADIPAVTAYLRRVQPPGGKLFPGGMGWLDLDGVTRASSAAGPPPTVRLSDRSYFRTVVATDKPYVSEALFSRLRRRQIVVMAVPTHDATGRVSGVLTGALLLQPATPSQRSIDLGFGGMSVLDRAGQQLASQTLTRPRNSTLVKRLRTSKEGAFQNIPGLDGEGGHVVAYATSPTAGWLTVLDQPDSTVFAGARRAFFLEVGSIAGAAAMVLALIAWAVRRARRDLRAERAQIGRWARLTGSLNDASDPGQVCEILADALAAEFRDGLAAVVLQRNGDESAHAELSLARSGATGPPWSSAAPFAQRLATAAYRDADALRAADDAGKPRGIGSSYTAPLYDDEQPVGGFAVVFAREGALGEDEQAFLRAHADLARSAFGRLRRRQEEHDSVVLIQRSLLPDELPGIEGLQLTARYSAGGLDVEIGGDWYDAVRRSDGIIQLTVGDVAGRGIHAAVQMSQLRNAFRAYALEHVSPAAVVERLERHVEEGRMVTTICAAFDPCTCELRFASAGHPPPLLLTHEGATPLFDRAARPPLGWAPRIPGRLADEVVTVPEGGVLALYTDGLVERRGESIDDGIETLATILAKIANEDLELAADRVLAQMLPAASRDDTALLLLRLTAVPSRVELEISAEPSLMAEVRRRLRRWLQLRGVDELQAADAVLAVTEACNNAIEHGYGGRGGPITIRLDHRGDLLDIVVEDRGTWRPPEPDPTRGHGLVIMEALMETEITPSRDGTRVALQRQL